MKIKQHLNFPVLVLVGLIALIGCAPAMLRYQLDPEVKNLQSLAEKLQTIAISVTDLRKKAEPKLDENTFLVPGPENEAETLKAKLIEHLIKSDFKITSNKLLANLAIDIQIEKLDTLVTKHFLKSTVTVNSQLRLKANKQSETIEKIFKMSLQQDVANPVNALDITGVVNQLLSDQLSEIFVDPILTELATRNSEQMDNFN